MGKWDIIKPQQVRARLHERSGLVLVIVRQAGEWQAGHMSRAVHAEAGD